MTSVVLSEVGHGCLQVPTDAYHPVIANLTEERKDFQSPGVVLTYLHNMSLSLPSESVSEATALNLTMVRRGSRGDHCRGRVASVGGVALWGWVQPLWKGWPLWEVWPLQGSSSVLGNSQDLRTYWTQIAWNLPTLYWLPMSNLLPRSVVQAFPCVG